jgi:hypothetical protein
MLQDSKSPLLPEIQCGEVECCNPASSIYDDISPIFAHALIRGCISRRVGESLDVDME